MANIINQCRLDTVLNCIFPGHNVIKNARKEAQINNPLTGAYLEVDVWYPELHIGFEFQDDYHYQYTGYSHTPISEIQQSDGTKRNLLRQKGETIILVPCWWDGIPQSLQATIRFFRPDLLLDFALENTLPIPENPPYVLGNSASMQVMLSSFPVSIELSDDVHERSPWWLGEKYDGVRCIWNPIDKQLYSRNGVAIELHYSVNALFGDSVVLDGEIWSGRGFFLEAQTMSQSPFIDAQNWSLFRVICFDEGSRQLHSTIFEIRYRQILDAFRSDHPTVIIASRFLCANCDTLASSLNTILEGGGEGVIMRRPNSRYILGRSSSLLKFKASRGDQEALVTSVEADGSIFLQLPNGTEFVVPKSDCVVPVRLVPGDVVTYAHDYTLRRSAYEPAAHAVPHAHDLASQHYAQHARSAHPSHPVVYRVRCDVSWEDVLRSSSLPTRQFANESYQQIFNTKKGRGYWTNENGRKMRAALESHAKTHGFDFLRAENWYSVSPKDFQSEMDLKPIIRHYGSLANAIVELFPEVSFDSSKFATPPNYFKSTQNRRALFERVAAARGQDPLVPELWYQMNSSEISQFKGVDAVLEYYSGYEDALIHLFPEINFDLSKFRRKHSVQIWNKMKTTENQKAFFENFALSQGFDPRRAENWYKVSSHDLRKFEGYKGIIQLYDGSLGSCLMHLYPDIGFELLKFNGVLKWQKKDNRTEALLQFASIHDFSPHVAENWYNKSLPTLESFPIVKSMLRYYKGNHVTALHDLLPNLLFDNSKFISRSENRK